MSTATVPASSKQPFTQEEAASLLPKKLLHSRRLFDSNLIVRAVRASLTKLNPLTLKKNPVMFVVEVGAAITTSFLIRDLFVKASGLGFSFQITVWLWFTV